MHCPDLSEPHKTTSPNWRQANSKLCQFNEAHLLTNLQTLLTRRRPIPPLSSGDLNAQTTLPAPLRNPSVPTSSHLASHFSLLVFPPAPENSSPLLSHFHPTELAFTPHETFLQNQQGRHPSRRAGTSSHHLCHPSCRHRLGALEILPHPSGVGIGL